MSGHYENGTYMPDALEQRDLREAGRVPARPIIAETSPEAFGQKDTRRLVFRYYGGGTEKLRERTGQTVEIIRPLTEADPEVGPMFRVRFPDGHENDAFGEELWIE
jgi:hypothetical protein